MYRCYGGRGRCRTVIVFVTDEEEVWKHLCSRAGRLFTHDESSWRVDKEIGERKKLLAYDSYRCDKVCPPRE